MSELTENDYLELLVLISQKKVIPENHHLHECDDCLAILWELYNDQIFFENEAQASVTKTNQLILSKKKQSHGFSLDSILGLLIPVGFTPATAVRSESQVLDYKEAEFDLFHIGKGRIQLNVVNEAKGLNLNFSCKKELAIELRLNDEHKENQGLAKKLSFFIEEDSLKMGASFILEEKPLFSLKVKQS